MLPPWRSSDSRYGLLDGLSYLQPRSRMMAPGGFNGALAGSKGTRPCLGWIGAVAAAASPLQGSHLGQAGESPGRFLRRLPATSAIWRRVALISFVPARRLTALTGMSLSRGAPHGRTAAYQYTGRYHPWF
jgi:hypothetical protein